MKDITIDDYKEHGPEFFEKYNYVKKQLGTGAKAEDVMSVMKALGAIVMKKRNDKKGGPFGFNKPADKEKDAA